MKIYIGVTAYINPEGVQTPKSVTWEDGSVYEIDRIPVSYTHLDVYKRQARVFRATLYTFSPIRRTGTLRPFCRMPSSSARS